MLLSWVRLKTPQSSRKDAHIPIPYWPRRPPQPLSRSDLVLWHETDMPQWSLYVRCRGQNGHLAAGPRCPSLTTQNRHCPNQLAPFIIRPPERKVVGWVIAQSCYSGGTC